MPQHKHTNVSFETPDGWQDRSVVAYTCPKKSNKVHASNLVMTRDVLAPGETLRRFTARQISDLAKELPGFELLEQRERQIGGVVASECGFTSEGGGGLIVQRLVIVALEREIISFTATSPRSEATQLAPVFERILASVEFSGSATSRP